MINYDFLNLSPFEFENLTRDLLQAHLKISLESFGQGRDKGIDLRLAVGKGLIVQCKRYSDYNSFYQNIKSEVENVKNLNPDKYLLCTSVSLSPERKQNILNLFSPFIKSTSDIYGRDELNNLLTLHPKIEKDNFKLWLSGTNILQTIINSQIVNQSRFVLEEIKEKISVYVQNASFFEANKVLAENHYVIISGIPGIGKTTLAEILVFDALANGFEEFIYLSDSINDGFTMFNEGKSQIFLFDDFLGSNFLANSIGTNEEKQIIHFINKIKKSDNKLLVFTTREYILNQAKLKFELFDKQEFVKCILDLSKYTTLVRAKILYNHLFFNQIPFDYIKKIIEKEYLMKIIQHANYNPRIIEYFSAKKLWKDYRSEDFPEQLLKIFDSPFSVWQHAFENQISERSRLVLYCLLLSGSQVEYSKLYSQVSNFVTCNMCYKVAINNTSFKSSLKELDNSFISISKDYHGHSLIKFQNPSIQDFLINYINEDQDLKIQLIDSAIFLQSLVNIFALPFPLEFEKKLSLSKPLFTRLKERIITDFETLNYSAEQFIYRTPSDSELTILKISALYRNLFINNANSEVYKFAKSKFTPYIYSENITNRTLIPYTELLIKFFSGTDNIDIVKILLNITPHISDEEDLMVLDEIKNNFPVLYNKFLEDNCDNYNEIFIDIISEKSSIDRDDDEHMLKEKIDSLRQLERTYDIDAYSEISTLKEQIEKIKYDEFYDHHHHRDQNYSVKDYPPPNYTSENLNSGGRYISEQEKIENIFRSLE